MFGLHSTLKFSELLKACQFSREYPVPCDGVSFLWQVRFLYLAVDKVTDFAWICSYVCYKIVSCDTT